MACHILAIPATIVASETTFSVGGRVIDELCASLLSKTIEALMTTKDWLPSQKRKRKYVHYLFIQDYYSNFQYRIVIVIFYLLF